MAEDQVGLRRETPRELPLWTKLFSGFKVALDPKKLLLAAAGILVMSAGWWVLSVVFYNARNKPTWNEADWKTRYDDNVEVAWKAFKADRDRWNLIYEMAAPVPTTPAKAAEIAQYDVADFAYSPKEYKEIDNEAKAIRRETSFRTEKVLGRFEKEPGVWYLKVGSVVLQFSPPEAVKEKANIDPIQRVLEEKKVTADKLIDMYDAKTAKILLDGVVLSDIKPEQWEHVRKELDKSKQFSDVEKEIREGKRSAERDVATRALKLVKAENTRFKPAGMLRTWPWFEYRGPNPYLLVTGNVKGDDLETARNVPWDRGQFLGWFMVEEAPVLIEPLVKFLRPVLYMLQPAAAGWNRLYLFCVILWTLLTWAVFAGAITRMAAVQVARNNEKIGMTEALRFAWTRFQSYFAAPVLPLVFLAILTILLFLYGLLEVWTFFIGDILIAGLGLPLALLLGLIMAVVLVGLVGWPMMYATISTEGSDSFDAISRSYSYVYQAPWHYLWYAVVAMVYGAALVFFVGLMGSLLVYMTKWGVSLAPHSQGRETSYLYTFAPTSFGWRDLLLFESPNATEVLTVRNNGTLVESREVRFTDDYPFSIPNQIGAGMVSVWLTLIFLMVLGFGYSYFWTASTIIYLLMRRKVDDTELDEIHLEEEELEEPYTPPAPAPATPSTAAVKAGSMPLSMVEAPALRTPAPTQLGPSTHSSTPTQLAPATHGFEPPEKPISVPGPLTPPASEAPPPGSAPSTAVEGNSSEGGPERTGH